MSDTLIRTSKTSDDRVRITATGHHCNGQTRTVETTLTPQEFELMQRIVEQMTSDNLLVKKDARVNALDISTGIECALIGLHSTNGTGTLTQFDPGTPGYLLMKEAATKYQSQPYFEFWQSLEREMMEYISYRVSRKSWTEKLTTNPDTQQESLPSAGRNDRKP